MKIYSITDFTSLNFGIRHFRELWGATYYSKDFALHYNGKFAVKIHNNHDTKLDGMRVDISDGYTRPDTDDRFGYYEKEYLTLRPYNVMYDYKYFQKQARIARKLYDQLFSIQENKILPVYFKINGRYLNGMIAEYALKALRMDNTANVYVDRDGILIYGKSAQMFLFYEDEALLTGRIIFVENGEAWGSDEAGEWICRNAECAAKAYDYCVEHTDNGYVKKSLKDIRDQKEVFSWLKTELKC